MGLGSTRNEAINMQREPVSMGIENSYEGSRNDSQGYRRGMALYDILERQMALFPDLFRSYEKAAIAAIEKVRAHGITPE
jgi:hypothetical protein